MKDIIVVGAGYAGSIMARKFAEDGKSVLLIEKRDHIAGGMYDYLDENNILVHKYGPHIAYMENQEVFEFLKQYTEFVPYEHHVLAEIDGIQVPLPFNLTAVDLLFDKEKAQRLTKILVDTYGMEKKVPILELRKSDNREIQELAEFIYEKVFLHYTTKMWGLGPEEMDPAVTGRVPVHISYDNRHFTSPIQVMPKYGYTKIFENMLDHNNIEIQLNTDALKMLELKEGQVYFKGQLFLGLLVYTGPIDELFDYEYGELPYRSLYFEHKTHSTDKIQNSPVLNWPDNRPATRRTENKLLTCQPNVSGVTSTITEYPGQYDKESEKFNTQVYPIINEENQEMYDKYVGKSKEYKRLILRGRLAEYKYFNMEATIKSTLAKYEEIKNII